MRASFSIMNLPASAACQLVPQAMILIDVNSRNCFGEMSISSRKMRPLSWPTRPSSVSRTARGCSKISLSMKCLYPPFSAMIGSQRMCETWRLIGLPSKSVSCTPSRVRIGHIPVVQEEHVACVAENRGHVGSNEVLVLAKSDTAGGPERAPTILSGSGC